MFHPEPEEMRQAGQMRCHPPRRGLVAALWSWLGRPKQQDMKVTVYLQSLQLPGLTAGVNPQVPPAVVCWLEFHRPTGQEVEHQHLMGEGVKGATHPKEPVVPEVEPNPKESLLGVYLHPVSPLVSSAPSLDLKPLGLPPQWGP